MIGPLMLYCRCARRPGDDLVRLSGPVPHSCSGGVPAEIPEKNVRVIYRDGSGSYGRLSSDDSPEDAALLSRAVGAPVRVQWSRHDEHGWEPKGPAQTQVIEGRC